MLGWSGDKHIDTTFVATRHYIDHQEKKTALGPEMQSGFSVSSCCRCMGCKMGQEGEKLVAVVMPRKGGSHNWGTQGANAFLCMHPGGCSVHSLSM